MSERWKLASGRDATIAVVDDDERLLESWKRLLAPHCETHLYSDPETAFEELSRQPADLALIDLRMPGLSGMDLMGKLLRRQPDMRVIVCTGFATVEAAVDAMRGGAVDFFSKPLDDFTDIRRRIRAALPALEEGAAPAPAGSTPEFVGDSAGVVEMRQFVERFASSEAACLLLGEIGTGKELVARALHLSGDRKDHAFIAVNCAAIADSQLDSELFGYEKSAFPGADEARGGLFEAADGGTLFLDEIGDVPIRTQARLLRAIQESEIRRLGATQMVNIDVRLIAASNTDLGQAMRDGKFREDLYYHLATHCLELPPLRDRGSDVVSIARTICERRAPGRGLTPDAEEALTDYLWPGNVRELINAMEYAVTLAEDEPIASRHLPAHIGGMQAIALEHSSPGSSSGASDYRELRHRTVKSFERSYLTTLLSSTHGNLSEAARRSGIDRSNLRRMLKGLGISPEDYRPGATGPVTTSKRDRGKG